MAFVDQLLDLLMLVLLLINIKAVFLEQTRLRCIELSVNVTEALHAKEVGFVTTILLLTLEQFH